MNGWRKVGVLTLLVALSAFTEFRVTWEIVALFATFCGANSVVHSIANRKP